MKKRVLFRTFLCLMLCISLDINSAEEKKHVETAGKAQGKGSVEAVGESERQEFEVNGVSFVSVHPPKFTGPPIKLGMSAAFSGPTSKLGDDMYHGMMACFHRVNRMGGVHGRKIELLALDDGYTPADAAKKVTRLIEEKKVLALIGCVGTPTAKKTLPIALKHKVLFFGGFSGDGLLRPTSPERYIINYRASYDEEIKAMIDWLITRNVLPHQIAFFTQNDPFGDSGYESAMTYLEAMGAKYARRLPHGRYERNQEDVSDAIYKVLAHNRINHGSHPKVIIMVGAYRPCAKFIRKVKPVLPNTEFINISFVGAQSLVEDLGKDAQGVLITQVVPSFTDQRVPVVTQFQNDFARYSQVVNKTSAVTCFVSLEGYIVAQQMVRGLMHAKQPLTRESVIDGLHASWKNKDYEKIVGTLPDWLDVSNNQMSRRVWMTRYDKGEFVNVNSVR